jgi:NADPH:quinone reductase
VTTFQRGVEYTQAGGPDVLNVVKRPRREPDIGEILVRIHRAGVNPTDWKSIEGGNDLSASSVAQVPGQDGSGVVEAVGGDIDPSLVGSRVWVWEAAHERVDGTSQELAPIPAGQVVPLPDNASFDLGACLGIPFMTAHRCLTVNEDGPTSLAAGALAGRAVLVAGGAGAVGNAAIQLARWAGATVITTVSDSHKAKLAIAAGADHVINYKDSDVVSQVRRISPRGVDSIVEVAGGLNAAINADVLARHGTVAVYSFEGASTLSVPIFALMIPNGRWQFVFIYTVPLRRKHQAIEDITAAVAAGAVRVGPEAGLPLHHFPLERARAAHVAVQRSTIGKVLIDVREPAGGGHDPFPGRGETRPVRGEQSS